MGTRLVSALSLTMLCLLPVIFLAVVLAKCETGIREFHAEREERARVERRQLPARVRALYAYMEEHPDQAPLAYSGSAWMCDAYHVRLRRDPGGPRLLEMDWRVETTGFRIFDGIASIKGRRVTLVLIDGDGDGVPDTYAGPRLHASDEEPVLSIFSTDSRRPESALIDEINDFWASGMAGLLQGYLPIDDELK